MIKWIRLYQQSSYQMKLFVFVNIVWAIAMISSTIYCYARLAFVQTYSTTSAKNIK